MSLGHCIIEATSECAAVVAARRELMKMPSYTGCIQGGIIGGSETPGLNRYQFENVKNDWLSGHETKIIEVCEDGGL